MLDLLPNQLIIHVHVSTPSKQTIMVNLTFGLPHTVKVWKFGINNLDENIKHPPPPKSFKNKVKLSIFHNNHIANIHEFLSDTVTYLLLIYFISRF